MVSRRRWRCVAELSLWRTGSPDDVTSTLFYMHNISTQMVVQFLCFHLYFPFSFTHAAPEIRVAPYLCSLYLIVSPSIQAPLWNWRVGSRGLYRVIHPAGHLPMGISWTLFWTIQWFSDYLHHSSLSFSSTFSECRHRIEVFGDTIFTLSKRTVLSSTCCFLLFRFKKGEHSAHVLSGQLSSSWGSSMAE